MNSRWQGARLVRAIVVISVFAACGGGGGGTQPETITITVAPSALPIIGLNVPATVTATVVGRLGTLTNVTVEWSSDNAAIATVVGNGNSATVTSRGAGAANIRATARGVSGAANVNVTARVLSVAITPKTSSLTRGATRQLTAQVTSDPGVPTEVDWSSLDLARATVTNAGLVTAVAGGTVRIVARSRFNAAVSDTATITIDQVTIAVAPKTLALSRGETRRLTAQVTAAAGVSTSVIWKTANAAVATVAQTGDVTGVADGTAKVWAESAVDASTADTATVTVSAGVRSIIVGPRDPTIALGGTVTLSATVNADPGVSLAVEWITKDPALASVSALGVVTGLGRGVVFIVARSVADPTKRDSTRVTISAFAAIAQWVPSAVGGVGPIFGDVLGMWGFGPNNVFASTGSGTIYRYDGTRWTTWFTSPREWWALWGTSPSALYAAGSNGTVAFFDGAQWTAQNTGISSTFYALWGSSATNVIAAGQNGAIMRYNGTIWQSTPSGTTNFIGGLWGASATDVFAVGGGGTILRFNGFTWSPMTSNTTRNLNAVWGTSSSNVYAVGEAGIILRFNGASWSQVGAPTGSDLFAISGNSANDIYTVDLNGNVFRFNGTAWVATVAPVAGQIFSVWAGQAAGVFIGSQRGITNVLRGATWTVLSLNANYLAVAQTSPTHAFTVGEFSTILRWDGANWIPQGTPTPFFLAGVWTSGPTVGFAVGGAGTALRYDGTGNWVATQTPTQQFALRAVWASSSINAFAVGESGILMRWNGNTWGLTTSGVSSTLRGLWGTGANEVWTVGDGGTIIRFNGTAWVPQTSGTGSNLFGVWGSSSSNVFAVGLNGTILRFDGTGWLGMTSGTSDDLFGVWGSGPSDVYAVGANGTILRFDGLSWTRMTSNTTQTLRAISGVPSGGGFAVGFATTIARGLPSGTAIASSSRVGPRVPPSLATFAARGPWADDVYPYGSARAPLRVKR